MRGIIAIAILCFVGSCTKSDKEAFEAARKQSEDEQAARAAVSAPAVKISPPVPGSAKIPCTQLIDAAAFQTALGEKDALTVDEVTSKEAEAASSCSLVRGGKKLNEAEQKAQLKKTGRLGVLPGDVICNVTAFCYTIEEAERFKTRCKQKKDHDDDTMGTYACVQVVAQGVDDVNVFRFFDADTKCILQVRGGPSNVNNDLIRSCAKAARDTIGPAQIAVAQGAGSGASK